MARNIWYGCGNAPDKLEEIMERWYKLSEANGDVGSCVLGAGFHFVYGGEAYFMCACSPWQGSMSWEINADDVAWWLSLAGCTDIRYEWGRMD